MVLGVRTPFEGDRCHDFSSSHLTDQRPTICMAPLLTVCVTPTELDILCYELDSLCYVEYLIELDINGIFRRCNKWRRNRLPDSIAVS